MRTPTHAGGSTHPTVDVSTHSAYFNTNVSTCSLKPVPDTTHSCICSTVLDTRFHLQVPQHLNVDQGLPAALMSTVTEYTVT